jgi:hypothetical protein
LVAAREQLLVCIGATCPMVVRAECSRLFEQVETSTPTIVIEGRNVKGQPTTAIRVTVDGVVAQERLDGRALPIDPGEHALRFEAEGASRDVRVVVPEGQKNRVVLADFEERPATGSRPAPSGNLPPPQENGGISRRTAGLVVAGVGVGLLGAAAITGFLAADAERDSGCPSPCPARDAGGATHPKLAAAHDAYDRADALAWASNVTLGLGVVALGIGGYLFLTSRPPAPRATAWVAPIPLLGGGAITWGGEL